MIRAATGEDPVLIRRLLTQAPMIISSGNGTPEELAKVARVANQWNAVLGKWRAEHPCL